MTLEKRIEELQALSETVSDPNTPFEKAVSNYEALLKKSESLLKTFQTQQETIQVLKEKSVMIQEQLEDLKA